MIKRLLLVYGLLFPLLGSASDGLDQSWQKFMNGLELAREELSDPRYFLTERDGRNLAEGYRYMLGHLNRMIEVEMRLDPKFPEFHRSMDMLRKWTGENPDTLYLKAPITGDGYYKVSGIASDTPPNMVVFQTITSVPGDTGELAEMALCRNQTLDYINSFELKIEQGKAFEILIGPQKPADYVGHFLSSYKMMPCLATKTEQPTAANWLSVREIFSDWERQVPLNMEIVRLDSIGKSRAPISEEFISQRLEKIGRQLPNQIRFWQVLQDQMLEVRKDTNSDGKRRLPINGLYPPAPPFTAGGAAGAQHIYTSGVFELGEDEALLVKVKTPIEPAYIGFQLNNLWLEGPDQQNYVSSLTGHQLPVSSDGFRNYIIAHKDPGVQGWVATTGLKKGTQLMRFIFEKIPPAELMPRVETKLVNSSTIAQHIPADTAKVSVEQRRQQIAVRQSHIKKRWRAH